MNLFITSTLCHFYSCRNDNNRLFEIDVHLQRYTEITLLLILINMFTLLVNLLDNFMFLF